MRDPMRTCGKPRCEEPVDNWIISNSGYQRNWAPACEEHTMECVIMYSAFPGNQIEGLMTDKDFMEAYENGDIDLDCDESGNPIANNANCPSITYN